MARRLAKKFHFHSPLVCGLFLRAKMRIAAHDGRDDVSAESPRGVCRSRTGLWKRNWRGMTGGKRNEKRDEKIEKFLRAYLKESESEEKKRRMVLRSASKAIVCTSRCWCLFILISQLINLPFNFATNEGDREIPSRRDFPAGHSEFIIARRTRHRKSLNFNERPGLPFLGPAKFEFHEMSQKPWRGFTWLSESPSRGECTRNAINRMLQLFMFVILRQWSRLARMVYWKLILIVLYWIISRRHFFGMTTRDLAAEPISIACSLFFLVHYFWPPHLVCWLYDAPNERRAATNVRRFNF